MLRSRGWIVSAVVAISALGSTWAPSVADDASAPVRARRGEPLEVQSDPYIHVPLAARQLSEGLRISFGQYASVQVNVDGAGHNIVNDAANEPSLAVDPTNRLSMVIGWRQFDTIASNFRQAGWAYTQDGGQTWHFPGVINPGHFRSDPVLDVNTLGKFEYDSLTTEGGYQATVFESTNGGVSWDSGHYAWGGDKQWLVVDRTGGPGNNNVYSNWTLSTSICNGQFTRSTDDGNTFEACRNVNGTPFWGTMAVGPDGTVYIASDGNTTMRVVKSANVQYAAQTPVWTYQNVNLGGVCSYGEGPNPDGLLGQANVCVDNSAGATHGYVYLLASVAPGGTGYVQVMFARSTNGGTTWSSPVRVNDDANFATSWHWFGTMAVAPNGRIDVVWNDTRNHPGTHLSELFYSYSEDGGQTWSPNVQVSQSFNPNIGYPNQSKIGDYLGLVSFNAGAHVAYSATFNGEQDVYYLYIPRLERGDMNCDGAVNNQDIDGFVAALFDPAGYAAQYPDCELLNADITGDGSVNNQDIDGFVAVLFGG